MSAGQFETSNQHVAAFLNYAGLVLLEVRKVAGRKTLVFVFDDPHGEGQELQKEFYADSSVSSAKELLNAADEVRHAVRHLYDGA